VSTVLPTHKLVLKHPRRLSEYVTALTTAPDKQTKLKVPKVAIFRRGLQARWDDALQIGWMDGWMGDWMVEDQE